MITYCDRALLGSSSLGRQGALFISRIPDYYGNSEHLAANVDTLYHRPRKIIEPTRGLGHYPIVPNVPRLTSNLTSELNYYQQQIRSSKVLVLVSFSSAR